MIIIIFKRKRERERERERNSFNRSIKYDKIIYNIFKKNKQFFLTSILKNMTSIFGTTSPFLYACKFFQSHLNILSIKEAIEK